MIWDLCADQVMYATEERAALQALLREHLQRNLVRIGRSWHFQSRGIPQVTLSGFSSPEAYILCSAITANVGKGNLRGWERERRNVWVSVVADTRPYIHQ